MLYGAQTLDLNIWMLCQFHGLICIHISSFYHKLASTEKDQESNRKGNHCYTYMANPIMVPNTSPDSNRQPTQLKQQISTDAGHPKNPSTTEDESISILML